MRRIRQGEARGARNGMEWMDGWDVWILLKQNFSRYLLCDCDPGSLLLRDGA